MPPKRPYTSEQIIQMLREAEALPSQGVSVRELAKKLGIKEQTFIGGAVSTAGFASTKRRA